MMTLLTSCLGFLCPLIYLVMFCAVGKVLSTPVTLREHQQNRTAGIEGEPVWSHGESYSNATASGPGAIVQTDSWTSIDNHGGLQVNNITSNGTVIGYQVFGLTNCSQESWASAVGGWSANALAYGFCNSSVLLDQPVSNTGVGKNGTEIEKINV